MRLKLHRYRVIWHLEPSGSGSDVKRVADMPLPFSREQFANLLVSNGVVIFDTEVEKSVVYRISTRAFCRFPQRGSPVSFYSTNSDSTLLTRHCRRVHGIPTRTTLSNTSPLSTPSSLSTATNQRWGSLWLNSSHSPQTIQTIF